MKHKSINEFNMKSRFNSSNQRSMDFREIKPCSYQYQQSSHDWLRLNGSSPARQDDTLSDSTPSKTTMQRLPYHSNQSHYSIPFHIYLMASYDTHYVGPPLILSRINSLLIPLPHRTQFVYLSLSHYIDFTVSLS